MSPLKMKESYKGIPLDFAEKDVVLQKVQINRPKRIRKRKAKEAEKKAEGGDIIKLNDKQLGTFISFILLVLDNTKAKVPLLEWEKEKILLKQEWLTKSNFESNNEDSTTIESNYKLYIIDILKLITTNEHELITKVTEISRDLGMNISLQTF